MFSPSLTWQDIQYLIVYTSDITKLPAYVWSVNGAGLKVSSAFGFGAIDAEAIIGSFYRPPSSPNDTSFLLDLLSSSSINFSNNLFLFGDFNHTTLSSTPNPVSSLLDHFSLDQIIQSPTRFSSTGIPAILDLALLPNSSSSTYSILPPVSTSDHLSLLVSVVFSCLPKTFHPPISAPSNSFRLYNKANFDEINLSLSSTPWNSLLNVNPNIPSSLLSSILNQHILNFVPLKSTIQPSRSALPPPWLTPSILKQINHRNNLFHRAKKHNSPYLMSSYKNLRNKISRDITTSKSQYFKSLFIIPTLVFSGPLSDLPVRVLTQSPSLIF